MRFCVIDCETIPNNATLPEGVKPTFNPDDVKLGNLKDAAKIKEKIDYAQMDFVAGLDKKMSLDPDLCEVVCFVAIDNIPNDFIYCCPDISFHNLIYAAWELIKEAYLDHIPLVSFNGLGFDLPVLWHQAMKLNIPVSAQMYYDLTKRYDNKYHYDLMEILATWDFTKKKTKSLAFYLRLFGLGEKTGEGSEIYTWWKSGDYDKIRIHCEADVELTAKLFEKLAPYIVKEV